MDTLLLQTHVIADVDWTSGTGKRRAIRSKKGLGDRTRAARLVIPLHVITNQCARNECRMNPVVPWSTHTGIDRPCSTKQDHRDPVRPRVVYGHRSMH